MEKPLKIVTLDAFSPKPKRSCAAALFERTVQADLAVKAVKKSSILS
jgi:hypothetical protein